MDIDPAQSSIILQLLLIVVLILINAYFVANEMAIVLVSKNRIHRKAEEENRKAVFVEKLLQEPASSLSAIQVVIVLVGFFNPANATTGMSVYLGAILGAWTIPYGETISMVVVTILLSPVTLIFGELISKRIVLQNAGACSTFCVKSILIISEVVSPFIKVLSQLTQFVLRLFDMKDEDVEESLSREEIRSMVGSGQENGIFGEDEADMIDSVFVFDDILAEEVVTPRPDIFCIDINDPQSEYPNELVEICYNRIPVYRDSIDNIIGTLNIKDFVVGARKNGFEHVDISCTLRKPFFALESKGIDDLLREMQSKHQHITISIDEYGSFNGIVTMEDLAEEVMGDIEDEYDEDDEAQIGKPDEYTYVLDGGIPIDDTNEELRLQLESDNYETTSGFLLDLIGQMPEGGEGHETIWNHIKFRMEEVKCKRIHKARLALMQEEGNSEEVQTADSLPIRVGNPFFIDTEQRAQASSICREKACIRIDKFFRMRQEEGAL